MLTLIQPLAIVSRCFECFVTARGATYTTSSSKMDALVLLPPMNRSANSLTFFRARKLEMVAAFVTCRRANTTMMA